MVIFKIQNRAMKINNKQNLQVFWISYANLMAGLLFVFILILGGVIAKYVLTQDVIVNKQQSVIRALDSLRDEKGNELSDERLIKVLKDEIVKLSFKNSELQNKNSTYITMLNDLENKTSELAKTRNKQSSTISDINDKNELLQNKIDELSAKISALNAKNNALSLDSEKFKDENSKNLEKITFLLDEINAKQTKFDTLLSDINSTKIYVKQISGLHEKIINSLRQVFGDEIDLKTGVLTLRSADFFDKNKTELKGESKDKLKEILTKYFGVLLSDEEISKNIEQIMIEGFTDSDGSYGYNLELSQRRAYEIMRFINSYSDDGRLDRLLVSSGRSYNNLVLKDGAEDKDASRRIEIKFFITNKKALEQVAKILEAK
ncbi:OmpA family protein [Campylobacter majalis]|uniref:OmpA family protein n=1 Tax=Campylobacter majalis TaxID=2790656 RepID=UPI003D680C85